MLDGIRGLPTESPEAFAADPRTAAAAESYLRRALEALLDLGRHVLAKGFGRGVAEYKEVPAELLKNGVLTPAQAGVLREMAGYRNRMVHFYDEVEAHECSRFAPRGSMTSKRRWTQFWPGSTAIRSSWNRRRPNAPAFSGRR